jgi:hypothetical protein
MGPSRLEEITAYAAAVIVLAGLGVALRSYVLNWIVGPVLGVVLVLVASRVVQWLSGRRS